jgi:hypothetical protein
MRKLFSVLIVFLIFSSFSFAQRRGQKQQFFNLGVKAVINGSWIGNLPTSTSQIQASSESIKIGYVAGLWGRINLIEGLFIQPELVISQTGGKYSYQFNSGIGTPLNYTKNITLTNLEFPLSIGYTFPIGDDLGLRINGGGLLSTILSAKQQYETGVLSAEQDIKNQVNTLQAALQGGIGIDFLERWSVDIRVQQNLTSLYEGYTPGQTIDALKIDQEQQRVISLQLIIGFKIL